MLLVAIVAFSCDDVRKSKPMTEIKIDFDKKEKVEIDDKQIVCLETSDSSVLFDICNVEMIDSFYVVHSRNFLKLFAEDGRFVRNIGMLGNSRNEYKSIADFFVSGDVITLYDFNAKSLVSYDVNGGYKGRRNVARAAGDDAVVPNHLYPMGDGYICVNTFGGSDRAVPCLSRTDSQMAEYTPLLGRDLDNGFFFPDDVCVWGDKVLYWQPLCDTLFVAEDKGVYPLYHFDLGEHSMPSDVSCKNVYERIDYSNKMYKEGKPFAGMLRYYSVYGKLIYFVCVAPGYEIVLCSLDTQDDAVKIYQLDFSDKNLQLQPFLKIIGDKMILSAVDKTKPAVNPLLVTLKMEDLR